MKKEKGFTLIELMVVVTIIGILTTILLPRMVGLIDLARERATLKNLKNIYAAILYQSEEKHNGIWPLTKDQLEQYLIPEFGRPIDRMLPKTKLRRVLMHTDSNKIELGRMNVFPKDPHGGWFYCNDTTDEANFGRLYVNCTHFDSKIINYSEYSCR